MSEGTETPPLSLGGWVDLYVDYAKELTDAPIEFHMLVGKVILSMVVGRRAYIEFAGGRRLFLNLYSMGVAPPSTRKTSAYEIGRLLLNSINKKNNILPDKCTPENLLVKMEKEPARLYTSDEFRIFLKDSSKKYNIGIMNDITKLYDCPDVYTVGRQSGDVTIEKSYLNFMVFLQPGAYEELISSIEAQDAGTPNRFEAIYITSHSRRPRKNSTSEDIKTYEELIGYLKLLDDIIPENTRLEIRFGDELHELIFEKIEEKYNKMWENNPKLAKFPSRLADQIYKNSALIAIQREAFSNLAYYSISNKEYIKGEELPVIFDTIEVIEDDVLLAINFTESLVIPSLTLLSLLNANFDKNYNELQQQFEKVKQIISKHGTNGKISRSKLLQNSHLASDLLNVLIQQFGKHGENKLNEEFGEDKSTRYYSLN